MGQRCGEEKRDEEEEKRKGVQTVTVQERTNVTCAQLSLRTDQNTGWKKHLRSHVLGEVLSYSSI